MSLSKRLILGLLMLLGVACGVSPEDAADELGREAANPEEWCDYDPRPPVLQDKFFEHPDGYGITSTYGCFDSDATWPGGFCSAPGTIGWRVRLFKGTETDAWFKNSTDEYGATATALNNVGWQITRVSSGTWDMEGRTGTTSSGVLGAAVQSGWINHGNITGQGDYWTYNSCVATLYRTMIENNQYYQAASPAQQGKYLKNLWQHEYGHCFGQAHVLAEDQLMSNVYYFPGPRFDSNLNFTAAQIAMFDNFDPLN